MTPAVDRLIEEFAIRLDAADVTFGHGTDNARDEAWRLVTGTLGDRKLTLAARNRLEKLLERRIVDRVPVPYLTGEAWFHGLRLSVAPGVMIPRSPMAEVVAKRVQPWLTGEPARILDLCCGSGCIGITAAHVFEDATVDLVDNDAAAIEAARSNVRGLSSAVSDRLLVIESDLFGNLVGRRYDLVLCNPPYAPTAELDAAPREFQHEPRHGLDGGADGLAVWRRIIAGIGNHLVAGGVLVGEVGNLSREFDEIFPGLGAIWLDLEHAEPQAGGGFGIFVSMAAGLARGQMR